MENLQSTAYHIWNVFVTSNLFNFTVFIAIFALLAKKFDFKGMLEAFQAKIKTTIKLSEEEKEEAQNKLDMAENAIKNLREELGEIMTEASKNAEVVGEKIITEAEKQLENIEKNATKVIEAEEKLLISKLTKSASLASIKVAKSNIEKTLAETPSLHDKYINESIDELDRLNF